MIGDRKPTFDWSVIRKTVQEHVNELNTQKEKDLTSRKVCHMSCNLVNGLIKFFCLYGILWVFVVSAVVDSKTN